MDWTIFGTNFKVRIKLKKIIVFCIIIFIVMININYAAKYNGKKLDNETISYDLIKSPIYLYNGNFLLIGDSYAYLMAANTTELYNYIVRPGYNITKIYFELLPNIKPNTFKYAFLFIGPNDYMEQLEPVKFKFVLGLTIDKLIEKGIKVILTDYVAPHHEYLVMSNLIYANYGIEEYNDAINEIIIGRNLMYVSLKDLMGNNGFDYEKDLVHPSNEVYEPLLNRVIEKINVDLKGISE